jgi:glucan biosynthesis protein C
MASTANGRRKEAPRRGRLAPDRPIVPARAPEGKETKPRYHAIDALRGMAMFLVISLHAALGYIERDIPGVLWCVRDSPTLPIFDWFCWWCMGVSNPLYFTIAGFFAVQLYDSRGLHGFVNSRSRRVLIPLLAGLCTVGVASLGAWSYGWLVSGRCTYRQIRKLRFLDPRIQSEIYGPGHLWFLEYLLLMLAVYGLVRWWSDGRRGGSLPFRDLLGRVVSSRWRPLLLAVPTTALLWISRHRLGIDAVLDRHNAFLPDPIKFLHHFTFFVVGASLYRVRQHLDRLAQAGPFYLALSAPVFVGRAWLLGRDWTTPLQGPSALALAVLGALFAWLVVFGFIGAFLRIFRRSHPAIVYLADSSYWIYLVHMPILGLIQVDLYRVPGHALWKFPVVWVLTLAIGFGSYQTLVRHTAIGGRLSPLPTRIDCRNPIRVRHWRGSIEVVPLDSTPGNGRLS